ncbi:MAG TPA: LapA family protein [Gaiellaceae bacterium]|nr:LapA family protein [Gaiellaceae bacterium]
MPEQADGREEEEHAAQQQPHEGQPQREEAARRPVRESFLWVKLALLLAVIAYVIAFVLQNNNQVDVDFVFGTTEISLTWVILICLAIGLVGGVLLSQLYRRRRRRH